MGCCGRKEVARWGNVKGKGGGSLRRLIAVSSSDSLSTKTNTYSGVGTAEDDVGGVLCIDSHVHSAEKEIGPVAETYLGVGKIEGQSRESSDIRDDDGPRPMGVSNIGILTYGGPRSQEASFISSTSSLMMNMGFLTPK